MSVLAGYRGELDTGPDPGAGGAVGLMAALHAQLHSPNLRIVISARRSA